ncbi:hypothetical protein TNIN_314561 [Trichonephila inaurata madagascariensis]|uniref:Uncharacterized protein n=1 Tax=Trichonephila inaurata madagascariensis TaxID=2747483 RepID=A0A8X6IXT5_9ARAC|nr:hypothetical protein TNIN_314561 [Trichonephila inaurata madagascariensis]
MRSDETCPHHQCSHLHVDSLELVVGKRGQSVNSQKTAGTESWADEEPDLPGWRFVLYASIHALTRCTFHADLPGNHLFEKHLAFNEKLQIQYCTLYFANSLTRSH